MTRGMKRLFSAVLSLVLLLALGPVQGAASEPEKKSVFGFYLDTVIQLTAYIEDDEPLRDALDECERYEQLLSRTVEGSDVWRINHADGSPVTVSEDTLQILETARQISELSNGAFDVSIAPVSTLWDFTSGEVVLPDADTLENAAALVDYTKIQIEGDTVTLPQGMMIDLGGIAKGYIADAVKDYLVERGVESAILSFGGSNIATIGLKPDGSPWRIGIQDIDLPTGAYMLVSQNFGGSTVTSGIYERGFDLDGVYYHHLLDSETGWPVQNELASVTIFSESSMLGDALSTTAFVLGTEAGTELIESLDGVEALFIARDRSVTCTSGAGQYLPE
ncbi:MAG: FAD:protein FMN transferase [Oscillospiraceae bacterium]|nr:FAD:protein FMN transferase [Oscillospiraceae bacterium]